MGRIVCGEVGPRTLSSALYTRPRLTRAFEPTTLLAGRGGAHAEDGGVRAPEWVGLRADDDGQGAGTVIVVFVW